ncbi:DUF1002 domain-containing protein [Bariatricus sp. SGI.154]|uniref:DUF1002 domain-containing protein n=1 Tax=Bariatricus sp. SGI.154 TaxID=3420549 RepID=UPI003D07F88E
MIMKKMKKIIPLMLAAALTCTSLPMVAKADSSKVVTLGTDLTAEQKTSMYEYFGTSADEVATIEVTNADERKYMEGIASEAQIGTRTYSCAYVEPTEKGGIQVKVANLTFVTSSMIASTLLTSGVENCNVVAASPIAVSGTGALTGIMMAYEKASGETLDEGQKTAATEELVTTGELADAVGQQEATDLMNDVKQDVIENNLTDEGEIQNAINDAANTYNITLTEDQMAKITSLMQNISQYDYDVKALKNTLDNLDGKSGGFFSNLWDSIKSVFTGGSGDGGIINDTKDDLLGADAIIDSTLDAINNSGSNSDEEEGFWDKVVGFFKNIFGGGDEKDDADTEDVTDEENTDEEDADTEDNANTDDGTDLTDDTDGNLTDDSTGTDGTTDNADSTGPTDDSTDGGLVIDNNTGNTQ